MEKFSGQKIRVVAVATKAKGIDITDGFEMKMISLKFVAPTEGNNPKPNSVPLAGALCSVTSPQSTPAHPNTPSPPLSLTHTHTHTG